MRILIITPTLLRGGTERFIMNFVKCFREHYIDIATFRDKDSEMVCEMKQYVKNIFELPYYVKKPVDFIMKCVEFYKNNKYDLVYIHANHGSTILYTFPLWFSKNSKIYYHSHNSQGDNRLLHAVCRFIIQKNCDKLFACSEGAAKYMYKKSPSIIINNGIEVEKYIYNEKIRTEMRSLYDINNEYVIGHVGRFTEQKNHFFLLEIFYKYLDINKDAKLVLIGDGKLKESVIDLVRERNIEDKVIIIDSTNEIEKFYQMFDLFILPSLYEGLPFVGIEAQASGTQCLFSDKVSKKSKITPLVHFCGLDDSVEEWISVIEKIRGIEKKDYRELIEENGYGLKSLKKMYKECGVE